MQFAAVARRDAVDDGQAQAETTGIAAATVIQPGEWPHHFFAVGLGDTGAVVVHAQAGAAANAHQ